MWSGRDGKLLRTLEGHSGTVCAADFSPDGHRVLTGSGDQTVRIWDTATGAPLTTLEGHLGTVNSAFFSPDGERVVSSSHDGTARIWEVSTGATLDRLEFGEPIASANFSPDGKTLGVAGFRGAISFWDVGLETRTSEEISRFVLCKVPYRLKGQQLVAAAVDRSKCRPEATRPP